jgi:DNA-binding MarR family transcriptional regulator
MTVKRASGARGKILEELARVGRQHSDASVLFHAAMASRLGLHPTDYKALSILERLGAMTAGDLSRHSGLATASVTNLIDRLERRGFVRRVDDPRDRRRVLVEASVDRVAAARKLFESTRKSLTRLYERYTVPELAAIADFLARNAARLRDETAKLELDSSQAEQAGSPRRTHEKAQVADADQR